jgi:tetratricopeptide (TPR) repeat protein
LASSPGEPADPEARAALSLVYDGDFREAEARLAALARAHDGDPVLPYLQALALEWRLEQDPAVRAHDAEVLALADRALGLAATRLGREPLDRRALLARGAAHGVKSRLHLFRWEKGPASREAVRMREALAVAREAGETALDLDFGLGLYDYYADTLPRLFKVVAFVLRVPGGDRERGLDALARVARGGSLFHDDEARVQMYDVHSYFEREPDRALHWIREMWRRHPGWPLWGLKLAQLLGEPMGLWGESAAVAREILATAEGGRHPNYQPVVAAIARVLLAEALLGDLRFEEACATAREVGEGAGGTAWVERAARVLERCRALEREPGSTRARGLAQLAAARRLRERGDLPAAQAACLRAFQMLPASGEARLCAAGESLRAGRPAAARALARAVLDEDENPWLRPFASLALARALEAAGDRAGALAAFRRAWEAPLGRPELRAEAAAGVVRLDPGVRLPEAPPRER